MSAIRSSQDELEEKMTEMLHKKLKGITTVVKQQAQNLHEFNNELQVGWRDTEATQHNLEATSWESQMQLVAVEAQTRYGGGGNTGTSRDRVKPNSDGSTSWAVFTASSRPWLVVMTGHPTRR
jgi:hypothetical protein